MCAIIGAFNNEDAFDIVQTGLNIMKERGKDAHGWFDGEEALFENNVAGYSSENNKSKSHNIIGHNLHSLVNFVLQPIIEGESIIVANCEIYNWEELAKEFGMIDAENDADLLVKLISRFGIEKTLKKIRGVYAFCIWQKNGDVLLARDILGIKPLWYSTEKGLVFASEKKALQGFRVVEELNPRKILKYDINTKKISFIDRSFIELNETREPEKIVISKLDSLIRESIKLRVPKSKFGLLFSGGIDSLIIAKVLKDMGTEFTCYVAGTSNSSPDVIAAKESARILGLRLKVVIPSDEDIRKAVPEVVRLVEDSNVIKIGVALPIYFATKAAAEDKARVLFSGSGADEVFGGYARYKKSVSINKDCYSDLLKLYEKNSYRDDVITMNNGIEIRVPFLDLKLVEYGINIPSPLKIKEVDGNQVEKYVLRVYAKSTGLPDALIWTKKTAAQYGSGFDKTIEKLAKGNKSTSKSEYLSNFISNKNLKLGCLISGGKDSLYAAYIMKKQNYEISCAITLKSENKDSFMFHTPNVHLVELQAEAMGVPLIMQSTKGEKEDELKDLKKALSVAKEKYKIEGVTTGALYSNYQRERIEKICDELGLKMFSPLWHIDQGQLMHDLLKNQFHFILSSVAAEGLDNSWLGKEITENDISRLVALNKEYKLNIAGEGGEFESLVTDCPLFDKELIINESVISNDGSASRLDIKKAHLKEK